MLNVFVIFSECISMLMWLHISFRRNINESKGKLLFCVVYVVYFCLCLDKQIQFLAYAFPTIMMIIWLRVQFREKIWRTLLKFFIGYVGLGISQLTSIWLMDVVFKMIKLSKTERYISACLLSLLFSVIIYCFIIKGHSKFFKLNVYTVLILAYVILLLVYLKFYYDYHVGLYGDLYIALITVLFVVIIVAIKGLNTEYKLGEKQLELEMKQKYEEAYSLLLLEMRRKQHDYKNQITALYSIHMVENDKDEITNLEKEYGDKLLETTKYDSLILNCDNPVLSGYIYTQCNLAMRKGINVFPNVMCANRNYNIPIHEVIEILGIVINNAIECLIDMDREFKELKIDIHDELDKLYIAVENITEYITYEMIEKMFDAGYSSKGNGRGVGLYSLKNIVNKNNGELHVENLQDEKGNWFRIKILI